VLVRDPRCRPGRLVAATGCDEAIEGGLAGGYALVDPAEEPQGEAESVARVGRVLFAQRGLKCVARRLPLRALQALAGLHREVHPSFACTRFRRRS
jgi:hypothetical protein